MRVVDEVNNGNVSPKYGVHLGSFGIIRIMSKVNLRSNRSLSHLKHTDNRRNRMSAQEYRYFLPRGRNDGGSDNPPRISLLEAIHVTIASTSF